jgi:hypothetical protein
MERRRGRLNRAGILRRIDVISRVGGDRQKPKA